MGAIKSGRIGRDGLVEWQTECRRWQGQLDPTGPLFLCCFVFCLLAVAFAFHLALSLFTTDCVAMISS